MGDFLLFSAGVNIEILALCPNQITKYRCIGAMVVVIALIASISMGFAIYTVFGSLWAAIIGGGFWGCVVVYNIDRLLLASMRAHDTPFAELLAALPRVVLATLLTFVISKPLELRMFRSEIQAELALIQTEAHMEAKRRIDASPAFHDEVEGLTHNNRALLNQIREARAQSAEAYAAASEARQSGDRQALIEKQVRAKQLDERLQNITLACESHIKSNEMRLASLEQKKAQMMEAVDNTQQNATGLLASAHALHSVCTKDSAAAATDMGISLISLALELIPLFVKVSAAFNKHRPYERLLAAAEQAEEAKAEITLKEAECRVKTEIAIIQERERVRLNSECTLSQDLVQMVMDCKRELAQEAVKVWADQQRDLLAQDPQQFFKMH